MIYTVFPKNIDSFNMPQDFALTNQQYNIVKKKIMWWGWIAKLRAQKETWNNKKGK